MGGGHHLCTLALKCRQSLKAGRAKIFGLLDFLLNHLTEFVPLKNK